jgi:hypothetical protein
MLKRLFSFKFEDVNITSLSKLNRNTSIEEYEFYTGQGNDIYIHDTANSKLLLVKTYRKSSGKNFYNELIAEYRYVYNIRWSGSLANKQKLTTEDAKFIFDQSEKQLKDTTDTANNIVLRVNTLIAIIVAIIVGLTSYIMCCLHLQ